MSGKTKEKYLGLNEEQKSVLIGSLLGDGYLRRSSQTSNTVFAIKRATSDKEYLLKEYSIFKKFCSSNVVDKQSFDKRTNKIYYGSYFETRSYSDFNYFYENWYLNKIKIIPNNLKLDSLSIAIWFFDDGTLKYKNNRFVGSFATNSFTIDEVFYLKSLLDNRYNVKFTLNNKTKDQYIIRGSDHQFRPLLEDIDKYSYFLPRKSNIWKDNLKNIIDTKSNNCIEKSILIINEMIKLQSFTIKDIASNLDLYYVSKKGKQVDGTLKNKISSFLKKNYIRQENNIYFVSDLSQELNKYLSKKKYY